MKGQSGGRIPKHQRKPQGERIADVLARLAIEVLDAEREETGVDEWDESDPRCYLYNAAYAVVEHDVENVLCYEPADDEYDDWLDTYDGKTTLSGQSERWLSKAICSGCGRRSAPRVTGTAPDGWRKFVDRVQGAVTYRCPNCPGRPVGASGHHTSRGQSGVSGG